MKKRLDWNVPLMFVSGGLLLFVNWLAFHDIHEPHTLRDWLMLVASALVLFKFVVELVKKNYRRMTE